MLDSDVKALLKRGTHLFGTRGNIMSHMQDVADNFFPERATFTMSATLGEDFASHLYSSYPLIIRRELANAISAMLRRRDIQWGKIGVLREDRLDGAGRAFLDYATKVQWRAMYDKPAQFVLATKQGDDDFVTFGQAIITREFNWNNPSLLFRNWHIANCAWAEDASGQTNELHIEWQPTYDQLCDVFGKDKLHSEMVKQYAENPHGLCSIRLIIVPSEYYKAAVKEGEKASRRINKPYTWLYVDCKNEHLILAVGRRNKGFCLPRWARVSGSPIAYSPAVVCALPDARLLQAITLTLLEAGESAVRPPMLAMQGPVRGDLNIYPGGATWVNLEDAGDRDLDQVVRPLLDGGRGGLPIGIEMQQDLRNMLSSAFFLNKLALPNPERAGKMTAFEISERIKEWIRSAVPLFEPMESEYNADLCEGVFDDLLGVGAFGPWEHIPESIKGADVSFSFKSPLNENIERQKAHTFLEGLSLITQAASLDQGAVFAMDVRAELRNSLLAVGVDPENIRDRKDLDAMADEMQRSKQAAEMAAIAEQGGNAMAAVGEGAQALGLA